jgi:ribosome modulation factor
MRQNPITPHGLFPSLGGNGAPLFPRPAGGPAHNPLLGRPGLSLCDYHGGYFAALSGAGVRACPYPTASDEAVEWRTGWLDAHQGQTTTVGGGCGCGELVTAAGDLVGAAVPKGAKA